MRLPPVSFVRHPTIAVEESWFGPRRGNGREPAASPQRNWKHPPRPDSNPSLTGSGTGATATGRWRSRLAPDRCAMEFGIQRQRGSSENCAATLVLRRLRFLRRSKDWRFLRQNWLTTVFGVPAKPAALSVAMPSNRGRIPFRVPSAEISLLVMPSRSAARSLRFLRAV